jgi:phage-related protein
MNTKLSMIFAVAAFMLASNQASAAPTFQDVTLGGVNLTGWCKQEFGTKFKAELIGKTAGDWTCQQSAGNRRPISVKAACKLQYGSRAYKAKALNWNSPYSWRCMEKRAVPVVTGVNLTAWCQKTFSNQFKAKLIGSTAGDWVCEQSAGNRRPISVRSACKLQFGNRVADVKALNWQSPYSWRCILKS